MGGKFQDVTHPHGDREAEAFSDEIVDQACLYAAGVLETEERVRHEALMENDPGLRAFTTGLLEIVTATVVRSLRPDQLAPPSLKERVCHAIAVTSELDALAEPYVQEPADSVVLTDGTGSIRWVNHAFTILCGFALEELRGRKPGSMLQGRLTDATSVSRIREAIADGLPCREELVNYHKDGHPYWAEISINPLRASNGELRGFVAIERELKEKLVPAEA